MRSLHLPALAVLLLLGLPQPARSLEPSDAEALATAEARREPPSAFQSRVESDDARVRARAATALGRLRTADALEPLEHLARDPEVAVRMAAAHALGQTPDSERALLDQLDRESEASVRATLLQSLGRQADLAGLRALVEALDEETSFLEVPLEARAASRALGQVALRDRDALSRTSTIAALVKQRHRFDIQTRRGAAFALARIRPDRVDPPVAAELVEWALHEPDAVARAFLIRATATVSHVDAAREALYAATMRHPAPGVRIATARAGGTSNWTGVAAMLADPNTQVRQSAIRAVGAIEALDRTAVLVPILEAGGDLEAAEDLQVSRAPRLLDAVVALKVLAQHNLLDDPAPWLDVRRPTPIRAAAVSAVTDLPTLSDLALHDTEGVVRTAAAVALADQEPPLASLLPLLEATDAMVGAIAAEAIGLQPHKSAEGPLLQAATQALDADLLGWSLGSLALLYDGKKPTVSPVPGEAIELARKHHAHAHSRVRTAAASILAAAAAAPPPSASPVDALPFVDVFQVTSARIQTDMGEFIIDLLPEEAPHTVWNFVQLAESGWYDGVRWHRVVGDFVAQTGDPRGDGMGGPAWTVPDEINDLPYETGVVGMAHAGPETAGSQWFVTLSPQPHLDGSYTAFGRVIQGMPVVKELTTADRIRGVIIERR